MPTLEQIGEALRRADAAGNSGDARRLAQAYVQMRDTGQVSNDASQAHYGVTGPQQKYTVTAPDGSNYTVTAPEGATQEQALAYAQANYQHPAVQAGQRLQAQPKPWKDVIASPGYQALPPDQQEAARNQYFAEVVAPQLGGNQQAIAQAKSQFDAQYGRPQSLPTVTVRATPEQLAAAQPRSALQDLGRAAVMTGRNVVHGALSLPAMINDATLVPAINAISKALGSNYREAPSSQQLDTYMNAAGIPNPQPENATERVVSAIDRGITGAGGLIGAGKAFAGAATPLVAGLGRAMNAHAGNQIASTATGAAFSELAHEAGAGAGLQTAAGLLGGMVPSSPQLAQAGLQGLLRGGEAGRQRVAQNIADFQAAGTMPTVGQATQNARTQGAESLLSKTPGAAGYMRGAAERKAEQVAQGMESIANRLSPAADPMKAGRTIERGISGAGGFMDRFKDESRQLYGKLDQVFPPNTPIFANNTETMLARMTTPTNRMQATSSQFIDNKLANIRTALGDDLDWNALMGRGRTVPYQGMKELRTRIGEKLADMGFGIGDSSIARSDLKRLYAALSQDMKEATSNIPEARAALNRANAYHAAGMSRIDALSRVVDKNGGPEAVFNAATSGTKDGATTLRTVMQSLRPDEQKVLASAIVRRLGKSTPGQQNAEGDLFSMSTFLTNWNKLSPQAKSSLFGRFGKGLSDDMDAVARMAANVRAGSKVFANPSGTATTRLQLGTAGAFIMSALTGHPVTAGGIAAGAGAANLSARLMTNPAFVRFLSRRIDVPYSGQVPNLANLYQMARGNDDPDLRAAADLIQQAQQGNR